MSKPMGRRTRDAPTRRFVATTIRVPADRTSCARRREDSIFSSSPRRHGPAAEALLRHAGGLPARQASAALPATRTPVEWIEVALFRESAEVIASSRGKSGRNEQRADRRGKTRASRPNREEAEGRSPSAVVDRHCPAFAARFLARRQENYGWRENGAVPAGFIPAMEPVGPIEPWQSAPREGIATSGRLGHRRLGGHRRLRGLRAAWLR